MKFVLDQAISVFGCFCM